MNPSSATHGTAYLVDAFSLIFQVFHAIPPMSSPAGLPTNALFGFTRDLLYLRKLEPTYLVCAFDRDEPTFRHEVFPEYKGHRDPMPDDLQLQMPHLVRILKALSIPVVSYPRHEADDVLATIAKAASQRDLDVFLCTSDKDCRQLIDDRVRLYNLRKRLEFGRAELLADWGITPEQVIDLQVLVGDPVDNVPGVPGIGVKTAAKLLQQFGTLDNVLQQIDQVPGAKKQEGLRALQPDLPRNRQLIRLETEVPLPLDWERWRLQPIDAGSFLALCREFGFHSFTAGIVDPGRPNTRIVEPPSQQEELFPFGANIEDAAQPVPAPVETEVDVPPPAKWEANYHLIDTAAKFADFLTKLRQQSRFSLHLVTTSAQPLEADVVGIACSWSAGEAYYLAMRGPMGAATLDKASTLAALRPMLEDPRIAKVNQNIKHDALVLRGQEIELAGVAGDSMVADYLLHAGERSHSLDDLAKRYLNHQVISLIDLVGKKTKKQPQLRVDEVETSRVATYAGEIADVAWRLCAILEGELQQPSAGPLRKLYDEVEVPLIAVLAELEANGVRIDIAKLAQLSEEMGTELLEMEQAIYKLAGRQFNIGSLTQLRTILFDELKLPTQGRTGVTRAASTDQETLEKLALLDVPGASLARKILDYRQLAKLKSTYVDALPALVLRSTGRVHASFNQTVAATGRLSASDPNLQNIPVRRERGQQIRQAFVPEPGWVLVTADYSQIELRMLAHFCGDASLGRAFEEDRDVHAAVAAEIYGVAESAVTPEMRRNAKTVNFGVIYGISPYGLAERLGISRDEARAFIERYFERYPKIAGYQSALLEACRRNGYTTTILGRRRRFDRGTIRARSTYQQRNQAEREAINMEIQGSAADLMKLAMLHVSRRLRAEKLSARMLLQIHDELVLESPANELPVLSVLLREEMAIKREKELSLKVPLRVDLAAGPNWLDLNDLP